MSLMRIALRMTAVCALQGKTMAGLNVYDSDNTPLAAAVMQAAQPYIVIYTDEDTTADIDARDVYASGNRSTSLVLEIGVASAVEVDGTPTIRIPPTDEGMEAAVDIIDMQSRAILFGNVRDPWCDLLKSMILGVRRIPSLRGGSAEHGTRWAARRTIYVVDLISDRPLGVPLPYDHVLNRFIALADQQSPSLGPAVDMMRNLINGPTWPQWRQDQAWMGVTDQEIAAVGEAPLYVEGDEEPQMLGDEDGDINPVQDGPEIIYPPPREEDAESPR